MDDKENNKGWEDNPREDEADDYGLPKVDYDPLDKDQDSFDGLHDLHDQKGERYYEYDDNRGSRAWVFVLLFVVLAAVGFGIYWFQFRDAGTETIVEDTSYQLPKPVAPEIIQEPVIVEEFVPPTPTSGSLHVISSPSSSYYVVVGSFIDDDLARDQSNLLNEQGLDTYLIEPANNRKFYRLGVGSYASWEEATGQLEEFKSSFGQSIWVLKY